MAQDEAFATTTLIGSATSGAARVDVLIGRRGGALETAWALALAVPPAGRTALVVDLRPGLPVRPATLVTVAAPAAGRHETLASGPAHAAVASAIARCVEEGVVPRGAVPDLLVLAALALDPATDDPDEVFAGVAAATTEAIGAAVGGSPSVDEVLAEARHPWNAHYHRHRN
jgi:5,6,7,8-tetrahydromethanopterin hydro-lyase